MKKDLVYLHNLLESITYLEKYLKDVSVKDFKKNQILIDAVSKRIENVGENTNKISDSLKKKYPNFNWELLIRNRNFLAHVYEAAKSERIYVEAKEVLPKLKKDLREIMKHEV